MQTKRLGVSDTGLAREQFSMMADVFEEAGSPLSDSYLSHLLARPDFWAIAACEGDQVVGGLTAHTLPMTKAEAAEIFIYDIAVREDQQRKGVGRRMIAALREEAGAAGIHTLFVPADVEDTHALKFYRAMGGVEAEVAFFTFSEP